MNNNDGSTCDIPGDWSSLGVDIKQIHTIWYNLNVKTLCLFDVQKGNV